MTNVKFNIQELLTTKNDQRDPSMINSWKDLFYSTPQSFNKSLSLLDLCNHVQHEVRITGLNSLTFQSHQLQVMGHVLLKKKKSDINFKNRDNLIVKTVGKMPQLAFPCSLT